MKSDCIWRSISIKYVQMEPGVNSDLGNGSFWVEIRDAKHVDRSSHLYIQIDAGEDILVNVYFLAKISLHRPKTTFARLIQSQAISKSIAFSSLSDQ